ncbi:hairy-related 8.2 isoform X2 [Pseudoliparis swirei]|uniref:hairy-related 8.2 isoform X2 n=1 Tax=Pseudoliparis swirei TaxID=2059687 RepID=UPI0024BEAD0F|nr:hairy-related 8.2 isoform X2 [Pseudoliparis swirei]
MTASSMAHDVEKHPSAKEERKLRKPLIERKRRERINSCLDQLKHTVVEAFRLDQSKLEKADILEMTVKHLQNIQSIKLKDPSLGLEAQQKYSTGYIQCMHEVHNMLLACHWTDKTLGSRLLNHLLKSLPRSTDHADGERRPPLQASPCRRGAPHPGTPLGLDPLIRREGPTRHEQRPALRISHLGTLEMWRPW